MKSSWNAGPRDEKVEDSGSNPDLFEQAVNGIDRVIRPHKSSADFTITKNEFGP